MTPVQRARLLRTMPRVKENPHSVAFFANSVGRRTLAGSRRRKDHLETAAERAELEHAAFMFRGVDPVTRT